MKVKSVHFVGVKGVGMTPLAIIAKEAGWKVYGSDIADVFITDESLRKSEITPFVGFSKSNIKDVDLVITTGAHEGFQNIEVQEAKVRKIPVITQGEAVGLFMKGNIFGRSDFVGISVAGTHGKTTTTAMIATLLSKNHLDPSFIIGTGNVPSLGTCGHYGAGKYFVAEADEYATEPSFDKTPKFLWQHPEILVVTNIEFDHPDQYSNIDAVAESFHLFVKQVQRGGFLIVNGDDVQVRKILQDFKGKVITYGMSLKNTYSVDNVRIIQEKTRFTVKSQGILIGDFLISVPGEHNALNALASIITAVECGISYPNILKSLPLFKGSKRRFEYIGKTTKGAKLYDDYAHHPTEIIKTLAAFRKTFPGYKIVCIFQPHTYSRTKALFAEFAESFEGADEVILTQIYHSMREKKDESISSVNLFKAISKTHDKAHLVESISDVVEYVEQAGFGDDTVVVTMGAGDIYKIHEKLRSAN